MATQPVDMFEPASYGDVRLPPMEAAGLPFHSYTSPEWFGRELDRIFRTKWTIVCREDEIPEVGDYFYYEYLNEPIIIVRGKDQQVRAFSASCRHRGTPIVSESGRCSVFHCPYHSWAYALDGSLLGGPPEMQETKDFDKSAYGLIKIRMESWDGFLFISLDPAAPSLTDYLGDLPDKLAPYNLADMKVAKRLTYEVSCNWKIYVENFMEEYHVATVHQKTIQQTLPTSVWSVEEPSGEYLALYGKMPGSLALLAGDEGFDEIPTLTERERSGSYIILANPNSGFGFTTDMCWWVGMAPVAEDRTLLSVGVCFPSATFDRPNFEEVAERYYRRLDTTLREDNEISELQQRGVRTQVNYRVGRLSYRERLVHDIANYVLDHVLDGTPA